MKQNEQPDYNKIYYDIIMIKFPSRMEDCKRLLSKERLTALDVITIDKILFGENTENNKHRSYNKKTILKILDYQKKNKLNNSQLAKHFQLSRNTVTKWKKIFI